MCKEGHVIYYKLVFSQSPSDRIQDDRRYQMIARVWRGWTSLEKADAYERLLREQVLPGLQRIDGYRGGYILRQEDNDEVEFVVMNLFDSLEAVRAFAGPEYTVPVFEPEARQLLSKVEPVARHYEVKITP
jgi:heme-degrading monooxygenase HmoA